MNYFQAFASYVAFEQIKREGEDVQWVLVVIYLSDTQLELFSYK